MAIVKPAALTARFAHWAMLTFRAVNASFAFVRPDGMKWRLLLPGASEPRLPELTRQDFKFGMFQTAYAA